MNNDTVIGSILLWKENASWSNHGFSLRLDHLWSGKESLKLTKLSNYVDSPFGIQEIRKIGQKERDGTNILISDLKEHHKLVTFFDEITKFSAEYNFFCVV